MIRKTFSGIEIVIHHGEQRSAILDHNQHPFLVADIQSAGISELDYFFSWQQFAEHNKGLFAWKGMAIVSEDDVLYTGTARRLTPEELTKLGAGEPVFAPYEEARKEVG